MSLLEYGEILFAAFLLGLLFVQSSRFIAVKLGKVSIPRQDRWSRKAVPMLGGLGIFCAASLVVGWFLVSSKTVELNWTLLAAPVSIFLWGLLDDFHPLTPPIKLLGQLVAATLVVFGGGFLIHFFPWPVANVLLTILWLVGITNAINLLDNMDGLASGVAFIAALFLGYLSYRVGDQGLITLSLVLAGSVLAFWCFNFPPAKIFMGDSGSMFIGFTLAELAVARRTSASNILAVMGVPILVFLMPILDTTLVTVTRLLRGLPPLQGGRDHTSHRLVSFGLSERQVLWLLYGIAMLSGISGLALETFDYDLSLALIPGLLIILGLLTVYLGQARIVITSAQDSQRLPNPLVQRVIKSRVWELLLDLCLVSICLYLAFWVQFGFDMTRQSVKYFLQSLPVFLAVIYLLYSFFGVYRPVWSSYKAQDLARHALSSMSCPLITFFLLRLIYPGATIPIGVFFLFFLFNWIGLTSSRASFVILDQLLTKNLTSTNKKPVFIFDASNSSEMLLRWIERDPEIGYDPVGLLDLDANRWGRSLRGVPIVGGLDFILKNKTQAVGVLISSSTLLENAEAQALVNTCIQAGLWVRLAHLEFDLLETVNS